MGEFVSSKPHYENILMLSKDGERLCTINSKRKNYYLKRGLANELKDYNDPIFSDVIQLTFKNKMNDCIKDYNLIYKESLCVICGTKEDLSVHHVVPLFLKTHLAPELKEHSCQWVVLCCRSCHDEADSKNKELFMEWSLYWKDEIDKLHRLTEFSTINKYYSTIPIDKREGILKRLKISSIEEGLEIAEWAAKQLKIRSPELRRESALKMIDKYGVTGIKQKCRDNFLELNPQFLPDCWLKD